MTAKEIASMLMGAGMTLEGACGVLGNWQCESLLQPDNVENRCPMSDTAYTQAVDSGAISKAKFCNDAYGYGYAQWTHPTRKGGLWDYTVGQEYSIADPVRQVEYGIIEFPHQAPDTFALCKTSRDLYKCVEWVCKYYERPAVNNIQERYQWALKFYNQLKGEDINVHTTPYEIQSELPQEKLYKADMATLCRGFYGTQVTVWQKLLSAEGYLPAEKITGVFDEATEQGTKDYQRACGIVPDGIAGPKTFSKLKETMK